MNEFVRNKPLSGVELREIILRRLEAVLEVDPMFGSYIGYGRARWTIDLALHVDNPFTPKHEVLARSEEGIPPIPDATDDDRIVGLRVEDGFDGPNAARVQNGLPIPVTVRIGQNLETKEVHYAVDNAPPADPPKVADTSDVVAAHIDRAKKAQHSKGGGR